MRNYADIGGRFLAMIIDGIILSAASVLLSLILSGIAGFGGYMFTVWLYPLISIGYYVGFEGGAWHATIGKHVMGIMIVDQYGYGITYSKSVLRLLGKFVTSLTFGIGYLIAFFNDNKQALHDIIAGTYVMCDREVRRDTRNIAFTGGKHLLIGMSGVNAGKNYTVTNSGIMIGRDSLSCRVLFPGSSKGVSRMHCVVTYNPHTNMYIVSDRNSTCGTYLANGTRIMPSVPMALRSGDRFYVGAPENMFEVRTI
ncbi:MAG: RDD family protein [Candidatus Ornithomonoglobus sp.]